MIRETGVGFWADKGSFGFAIDVGVRRGEAVVVRLAVPGWLSGLRGDIDFEGVVAWSIFCGDRLTGLMGCSRKGEDLKGLDESGARRL